jgi:hypothetical protein
LPCASRMASHQDVDLARTHHQIDPRLELAGIPKFHKGVAITRQSAAGVRPPASDSAEAAEGSGAAGAESIVASGCGKAGPPDRGGRAWRRGGVHSPPDDRQQRVGGAGPRAGLDEQDLVHWGQSFRAVQRVPRSEQIHVIAPMGDLAISHSDDRRAVVIGARRCEDRAVHFIFERKRPRP